MGVITLWLTIGGICSVAHGMPIDDSMKIFSKLMGMLQPFTTSNDPVIYEDWSNIPASYDYDEMAGPAGFANEFSIPIVVVDLNGEEYKKAENYYKIDNKEPKGLAVAELIDKEIAKAVQKLNEVKEELNEVTFTFTRVKGKLREMEQYMPVPPSELPSPTTTVAPLLSAFLPKLAADDVEDMPMPEISTEGLDAGATVFTVINTGLYTNTPSPFGERTSPNSNFYDSVSITQLLPGNSSVSSLENNNSVDVLAVNKTENADGPTGWMQGFWNSLLGWS